MMLFRVGERELSECIFKKHKGSHVIFAMRPLLGHADQESRTDSSFRFHMFSKLIEFQKIDRFLVALSAVPGQYA
jgi:hypothetical protein